MRRFGAVLLLLGVAACASASRVPPERLRLSAQDAAREARTTAVSWTAESVLRYVEGEGITPEGYVFPGRGSWRFIYEAPGRADQLVVTVTPKALERATRPKQSPPGVVLGAESLPAEWIDSPEALSAVRKTGGMPLLSSAEVAISMVLVPLRPAQWIVRVVAGTESRTWRVDARTGKVIG